MRLLDLFHFIVSVCLLCARIKAPLQNPPVALGNPELRTAQCHIPAIREAAKSFLPVSSRLRRRQESVCFSEAFRDRRSLSRRGVTAARLQGTDKTGTQLVGLVRALSLKHG